MVSKQFHSIDFHLLGEFSIHAGEKVIPPDQIRLRKGRSLLKILALAPDHRLHRDQVIEMLWPETDPDSAGNNLNQAIYGVRRVFKAYNLPAQQILQLSEEFLRLCPEPDFPLWVDVEAFEAAAEKAQAAHDSAAIQVALDLYTGDLLLEDLYEDWVSPRRESLRQERQRLQVELAGMLEAGGEYLPAITQLQQVLDADPAYEEAHAGLMRLYARTGQRLAALAQYETCRLALEKELGVEPSSQTTLLYKQIRDETLATIDEDKPPVHLPTYLIPFVGRHELLASIREQLADPACRLLTLVGPGGTGKTRLAVEAVSTLATNFPDGIFFVPLVGLQLPEGIVLVTAQTLGFSFYEQDQPRQQLLDYLRSKTLLLVLDNFEHLLEGAGIITQILEAAPGVKVLATSRARLDLLYETLLPIRGMEVCREPGAAAEVVLQFSAVRLFMEGARRVLPGFIPDEKALDQILGICRLLEGTPLAILLAAGWMRLLTPVEIHAHLDEHRLDFLDSQMRDLPERQRSMRTVFDHSWLLLEEKDRRIFASLSVFQGSFTAEAARQVCGAGLVDLARLVDQSLLNRNTHGRFELHDLLQVYAQEKLGETPDEYQAVHKRHASYFTRLLSHFGNEYMTPRRHEALAEMDLEIGNARAAWEHAVRQHEVQSIQQGKDGLERFYHARYRYLEGEQAFRLAYDMLANSQDAQDPKIQLLQANLLAGLSKYNAHLEQFELSEKQCRQVLDMLEQAAKAGVDVRRLKTDMLRHLAVPIPHKTFVGNSLEVLDACLAAYREMGDRYGEAKVLSDLGVIHTDMAHDAETIRLWKEVMNIASELELDDEYHDALINQVSQQVRYGLDSPAEAKRQLAECIAYFRQAGNLRMQAMSIYRLSMIHELSGQFETMLPLLVECAEIWEKVGNAMQTIRARIKQGYAHALLGQYSQAREILFISLEESKTIHDKWRVGLSNCLLGEVALVQGQPEQASSFLQSGLKGLDRGTEAQKLPMLAIAHLKMGEQLQARQTLVEAFRHPAQNRPLNQSNILASTILYLAESGELERAVELHALACSISYLANSAIFQDLVGDRMVVLTRDLPPEVAAAAQERGRQRDLRETILELQKVPEFSPH